MFAKGKAIREAKKAEIIAKIRAQVIQEVIQQGVQEGVQSGTEQERRRIEAVLARHAVALDKEVVDELFGDSRST